MEEELKVMKQITKALGKLKSADARRRILQYLLDHNAEELLYPPGETAQSE